MVRTASTAAEQGGPYPEIREAGARWQVDQDSLDQQRLRDRELGHATQYPKVRRALVLRGVVREHQVKQQKHEILQADREVVHHAPRRELRDDAREHPRNEHAEQEPGEDDGQRGRLPLRRREVCSKRHEDLRDDSGDPNDKGERFKCCQALRDRKPDC